jgi:hypothetical protein
MAALIFHNIPDLTELILVNNKMDDETVVIIPFILRSLTKLTIGENKLIYITI